MSRKFLAPIGVLARATDPTGTAAGEIYYNTTNGCYKEYDGTSWKNLVAQPTDGVAGGTIFTGDTTPTSPVIGDLWVDSNTSSTANGSLVRWQILATAGQTTLSGNDVSAKELSYVPGYEQVYINGALQYRGSDYTATTGTTITGIPALRVNDVVEVISLTNVILPAYTSYSSTAPSSPAVGQLWVDTSQAVNDTASYAIASTLTNSFRNALHNGDMRIDQRNNGAAQTITAGAALAYTVDRWYAYCTGANVTGQRIGGSAPDIFAYRLTGATSNTAVGFGQRIELANSSHLAGKSVSLSAFISSSSLTSLTWTAYYANTADTFGTLASPTRTQIATGTFTISSILGQKTATFNIPSAATTGIEIVFTGGALLASQTLTFTAAQLELGSVVTPLERRPIGTELALCQRYYQRITSGGTATRFGMGIAPNASTMEVVFNLPVSLRATPAIGSFTSTGSGFVISNGVSYIRTGITGLSATPYLIVTSSSPSNTFIVPTNGTGTGSAVSASIYWFEINAGTAWVDFSAEL
jgi:hypothetical protein